MVLAWWIVFPAAAAALSGLQLHHPPALELPVALSEERAHWLQWRLAESVRRPLSFLQRAPFESLAAKLLTEAGSNASSQNTTSGGIPKLIHTTWKSWDRMTAQEHASAQSWIEMNPGWRYVFWDDEAVARCLQELAPPEDASMLQDMLAIERFDYFRYLVLFRIGGVYADIDVSPKQPVEHWWKQACASTGEPSLITGWEARLDSAADEARVKFSRQDQVQQWTIVGRAGHPVLKDVLERIRANYKAGRTNCTVDYTGPGPWSDAVLASVGSSLPPRVGHGESQSNRICSKSVLVLEKEAFAYPGYPGNVGDASRQLVKHNFLGSWK